MFAIAATVAQVILGTGVLVMMLSANPSVALWVSTTVAHVVAGTLTLVATAMFQPRCGHSYGGGTGAARCCGENSAPDGRGWTREFMDVSGFGAS